MPVVVIPVDPCGSNCDSTRVMDAADLDGDHVGDNLISITSEDLIAANPTVWPKRADTEVTPDGILPVLFAGGFDPL